MRAIPLRTLTFRQHAGTRQIAALIAGFLCVAAAAPASAQSEKSGEQEQKRSWIEEMSDEYGPLILGGPQTKGDASGSPIDDAFERLASPDEVTSAKAMKEISEAWSKTGSASMDLLALRGKRAIGKQDWDAAEEHLTQLVNLDPDYAQGWVLRAGARLQAEKFGLALSDAAEALRVEPRHYEAMIIAAAIFFRLGRKREALGLAKQVLLINPHSGEAKAIVRETEAEIEGVDT